MTKTNKKDFTELINKIKKDLTKIHGLASNASQEGEFQGQQEGGNHGGGNVRNRKTGNQKWQNSSIVNQQNQGGDYKGGKNKK